MNQFTQLVPAGVSDLDLALLRQTIALSQASKQRGRHPFAALVADRDGNVIAEAGNNSMPPEGDPTQHAELVAVAAAAKRLSPTELEACTLYTSAEPCCMCAGAVYWTGVGRVVYACMMAAMTPWHAGFPPNDAAGAGHAFNVWPHIAVGFLLTLGGFLYRDWRSSTKGGRPKA